MYPEDKQLAEQCEKLAALTQEASLWLADNHELVGRGLKEQQKELRKAGRLFKNCAVAAMRKMCVGVFGPSQAGKSYLISTLACKMRDTLWANLGDKEYNFLLDINPEGGRESTGLVTRFTIERPATPPAGFPVHVRLLSFMDLVKILANSYYSDAEHLEAPDLEDMLEKLTAIESGRMDAPRPGISEDDMEDLQTYLFKYFRGKPRVQQLLNQSFWERVVPLAPYLDDAGRLKLLGLLWDNIPAFDELLANLWQALKSIDFAPEAFCRIEALIPREDSIIDVYTLARLKPKENDDIEVMADNGRSAFIPRVYLAALTAELVMPIRDKPADFFDHTDLLDFPGYRSREEFKDLATETQNPEILEMCFLRGKVAYLFQRYSAERELTSLLLCIADSVQEVKGGLGDVVNDWIISTHGETPETRTGKDVALFFILTKSDLEFVNKGTDSDVSERWDIRIGSSLLQPFATRHEWPRYWDKKGPFNNLFLLRNTKLVIPQYDHGENDQETALAAASQEFISRLEDVFMKSALVNAHFKYPGNVWKSFIAPNDGGVAFIRERLSPLCQPELKRAQIKTTLSEQLAKLKDRLSPYWKNDDREAQRKESALRAQKLARIMLTMAQNQSFGQFLRCLMLEDQELYDLYQQARYQIEEESAAFAKASPAIGARVSAEDMLFDLLGEGAEVKEPFVEAAPKDEAAAFVGLIERFWLSRLNTLADDPAMQKHFNFPGSEFAQFIHELVLGFKRAGVAAQMEEGLRQASSYANVEKSQVLWKQVSLASSLLNSFINWLGYDPRVRGQVERALLIGGKQRMLFTPVPEFSGLPNLEESPEPYERAYYTDWAGAFLKMVEDNVNFDGEDDFDPQENQRLKDILEQLAMA